VSASFPLGARAYGQSLRCATADEQIGGTNPVDGTYVRRACGRKCGAPIAFVATHRLDDTAGVPRLFRRYVCRVHAERYAKRYQLAMPFPPRTDQALLPFYPEYAERGEADDANADLPL